MIKHTDTDEGSEVLIRLEDTSGSANKFYEIIIGRSGKLTFTYGKIGSFGNTSENYYDELSDNPARFVYSDAYRAAIKKLKEKLNKGYLLSDGDSRTPGEIFLLVRDLLYYNDDEISKRHKKNKKRPGGRKQTAESKAKFDVFNNMLKL